MRLRIGIVGLSSKADAWATLAHLPHLKQSPEKFEVVAVCNSSPESTRRAIEAHGLTSAKAYNTYAELAADPNVDLYVVSTRADTHLEVTLPALEAGKNVFVEWPLAATTEDARKMADLARKQNVRTMIGFQGRMSPSVRKIRQLVNDGVLGVIHSVNYYGAINNWPDNAATERYGHFMDRKAGANALTIYGGHVMDSIFFALGELLPGSYTPLAVNLRPQMRYKEADGGISSDYYPKDTPDQIMLQGLLDRKPPAAISLHLRAGARFIGSPGSTWKIFGTKGELVVDFESAGPQMGKAMSMKMSNFETKTVETLTVDEGGAEWEELPKQGQNIGRLYEAYAAKGPYGDFDLAVARHELLDEFWASMKTYPS